MEAAEAIRIRERWGERDCNHPEWAGESIRGRPTGAIVCKQCGMLRIDSTHRLSRETNINQIASYASKLIAGGLSPSFFSAIAAAFAAYVAFLAWDFQRTAYQLTIRPDLEVSNWQYEEPGTERFGIQSNLGRITYKKVTNYGGGPAFDILFETKADRELGKRHGKPGPYAGSASRISLIEAGGSRSTDGEILVFSIPTEKEPFRPIELIIYFSDAARNRYESHLMLTLSIDAIRASPPGQKLTNTLGLIRQYTIPFNNGIGMR